MSRSTRFFGGAVIAILGFVFSASPVFALTITTSDGGIVIYVTDTTSSFYDWSPNSGGGWLTGLGEGDGWCIRSGAPCSGSPDYDFVAQDITAGANTIYIASPTGTRDTDICGLDVSGNDDSDWVVEAGSTILGTCDYVGFGGGDPPADPDIVFATSTGVVQDGDIPFLLGVILVLLMYFFIWHVYGKLFNIWPLS